MGKMNKKGITLIFIACILTLISCSKNDDVDQEDEEFRSHDYKSDEKQEKQVTESEEPVFTEVFPLSGVGTNEGADRRPVAVMVNNHHAARPQSGLSKADIVFEILAEGNITRFLALFQSEQPEMVGPVRSAREYYFELANNYDAIYVYHGAADFINDMIRNRGIDHLSGAIYDNDGHLFKRESFRKAPHNSYLLFDTVYEVSASKGYDIISHTKRLPFIDEDELIEGDPGDYIKIAYPGRNAEDAVEFFYDHHDEIYTRYENQRKTVELDSEAPIQVDNVFIIETDHTVIDDAGRRAIDLDSGGNAYLIQKGHIQKLEWKSDEGRIIPYKEGIPVGFIPGKTWINVIPANPGLEMSVDVLEEKL